MRGVRGGGGGLEKKNTNATLQRGAHTLHTCVRQLGRAMDSRKRKRASPKTARSPSAAVRARMVRNLHQRCTTFATAQRGGVCYMSAATLIVGRTLLPRVHPQEIRNYVLLTQAQAWDAALGPEDAARCPRIPYAVRRYYERVYTFLHSVHAGRDEYLMQHKDIHRVPRPHSLDFANGGQSDLYLSAILWAAFQKEHIQNNVPPVPPPAVGNTVRIVRPNDARLQQLGRIVRIDPIQQGALVQFSDGPPEALRFSSFTVDGRTYPLPGPPPVGDLPRTCKTLLVKMPCKPALTWLAFRLVLPTIEPLALRNGYRVLAMIVAVPRHALAAFPCVTFTHGWMFCNTWRGGEHARCQTLEELKADLLPRNMALVDHVSVLYQRL